MLVNLFRKIFSNNLLYYHGLIIVDTLDQRSGDESWGFTIAGGIDLPFLHRHFTSIIVTNIRENGLAYRDKRLKSTTATAPKDLQSDSETNTHVEQLNNLDKRINFRLCDSPQITFDDKKSAQQLKENEAVIRRFFCHIFFLGAAKEEKLRRQQSKISQNARLQRAGMATGINGTLRVSYNFS
ncbi:unnamed protein product [Rotaria sp. Silwood1]|nr:unnamed protein product [Rotaria sp. Silwood1]